MKEKPVYDRTLTDKILDRIKNARRPVIFAGTAIRLAGAEENFPSLRINSKYL